MPLLHDKHKQYFARELLLFHNMQSQYKTIRFIATIDRWSIVGQQKCTWIGFVLGTHYQTSYNAQQCSCFDIHGWDALYDHMIERCRFEFTWDDFYEHFFRFFSANTARNQVEVNDRKCHCEGVINRSTHAIESVFVPPAHDSTLTSTYNAARWNYTPFLWKFQMENATCWLMSLLSSWCFIEHVIIQTETKEIIILHLRPNSNTRTWKWMRCVSKIP